MAKEPFNAIEVARAKAQAAYERKLVEIDRVAPAYKVAADLAEKWLKGRKGRDARVWHFDGSPSVSLYFGLAAGEIFGDAEEAYTEAEAALRAAFPADWSGAWSEMADTSSEHEASRGSTLDLSPPGNPYWSEGARVYLHVFARVGEGSACNVVKIGEKQERDYSRSSYLDAPMRTVPVFKAVCPGDAMPLQAAE